MDSRTTRIVLEAASMFDSSAALGPEDEHSPFFQDHGFAQLSDPNEPPDPDNWDDDDDEEEDHLDDDDFYSDDDDLDDDDDFDRDLELDRSVSSL